uniref:Calcium-binding EF hand family protein n=1 Tax=Zea mays TaxID=4577 RepID=A0A804LCZ2_MAIZE
MEAAWKDLSVGKAVMLPQLEASHELYQELLLLRQHVDLVQVYLAQWAWCLDNSQPQQTQPIVKSIPAPATPVVSAGISNSASQWPKITQPDIQKYMKVFGDVDRDRDGKITGAEARTLFLSWRLPREVLKQVWDLSDQDNDGMLSLREFCIALYLMERHRAGIPLPPALPDSLRHDETLLRATGLPSTAYNSPSWQHNQGGLPQRGPGAPGVPAGGVRPPLPSHLHSQTDGASRQGQPRSHMPGMDNHVVIQGNKDDKSALNQAAQEVVDAPKKVEVEKQVLDSREKLEYYRTKMQDLVLYKSRCENRLNEITERASSDKREVESLAKKYEEKYKQVAELASKLAVEEAAYRDVQERKVELHDALIKMVQGGSVDGLLQVRADRIQYQLEEMEKALSERCKHFELKFKPSASVGNLGHKRDSLSGMKTGINLKMKGLVLLRIMVQYRKTQFLLKMEKCHLFGMMVICLLLHPLMVISRKKGVTVEVIKWLRVK